MKSFTALQMIAPQATGPIANAVGAHLTLVVADEALFNEDGDLLVSADEVTASETACNGAFRALLATPCASIEDVRAKVDYFLNGTVGERAPIHMDLTGFANDGRGDTYAEDGNLMTFLRSLSSAAAPSALPVVRGVEILSLGDLIGIGSEKASDLGMLVTAHVEAVGTVVPLEDGSVSLTAEQWNAIKGAADALDDAALAAHEAVEDIREAHAGGVR